MNDERTLPSGATVGSQIEQIEREISDLQADLGMIAAQLSDRDRRDRETGDRQNWREYAAWRSKALYARGRKEQQIRELRIQRKTLLREGQRLVIGGADPIAGNLAAVCQILVRRAKRGDLDPSEEAVLSQARAALVHAYGDNALGGTVGGAMPTDSPTL